MLTLFHFTNSEADQENQSQLQNRTLENQPMQH